MAPFRVMGSFPDTTAFEIISGDDRALSYFKLKWVGQKQTPVVLSGLSLRRSHSGVAKVLTE